MRRERERIAHEAVLESGDELGFPVQALHLPCPEDEGGYGDEGEDDEARTMSLPCADEVRWMVDDGEEVWIIGSLSGAARGLRKMSAGGTSRDGGISQSPPLLDEGSSSSWAAKVGENGPRSIHERGCGGENLERC